MEPRGITAHIYGIFAESSSEDVARTERGTSVRLFDNLHVGRLRRNLSQGERMFIDNF